MSTASDKGKTTPTRVYVVDGEVLYWLQQATGKTSAAILRPMIRAELSIMFERHLPAIETVAGVRGELEDVRRLRAELGLSEPELDAPPASSPPPPPTPRRRRSPGGS